MPGKFTEKILLYRVLVEKDPDSYAALYDLYVKQIYRFVFFKVSSHEEAEDITSEVFLKTWNYLQENKKVLSLRGLLYRIARNCIIDSYRFRSSRPEVRLDQSVEVEIGDDGKWFTSANDKIDGKQIVEALKCLKQEYREVLTLKFIDELETDEIAEIVGKGKIAVRVTLHRAINKLKDLLAEKTAKTNGNRANKNVCETKSSNN